MKKKIIAIVLVAVLVGGGLGSFAYAQDQPANDVHVSFDTQWDYTSSEDTFADGEVTGRKAWSGTMQTDSDETGASVTGLTLTLDSEVEFDWVGEENLVTMGPPTYEWSFGDVPEGSVAEAGVEFRSPDPCPVTFTPGFDASRTADKTEFLQSEGTQTQTVTITLTPRQVSEWFNIGVSSGEDDVVNPVIISPTTDEEQGIRLSPDGHQLNISTTALELDTTYTYYVTIEVTPKVPELEFMPHVDMHGHEGVNSGTTTGSSVSCPPGGPASEVGTWTLSATGSYTWHWNEVVERSVRFEDYSREVVEPVNEVGVDFRSHGLYAVPEESFINHEVAGSREWATIVSNWGDETGAPVTGLTVTLNSLLEFDQVWHRNLTVIGPPIYEWSFGDLAQEAWNVAAVRYVSPNPLFPVTFTPGFDASCSVDKTEFLQSEGAQTQTVTITLTPRQAPVQPVWYICVDADDEYHAPDEYDLVDAVINPPTSGDEFWLYQDGHKLIIFPAGPELDTTYTYYVTIELTPKVPKVEFMPYVQVFCDEAVIPGGTAEGNSVSCPPDAGASEVGSWTVSAEGSYVWHWNEIVGRAVEWQSCYREIVDIPQATEELITDLEDIVLNNPDTPLADKVEDALAKAETALDELTKTPPDNQAAVGNIEGAVGDLEAAVSDGLLDPVQGTQLMDEFAAIARQLAVDALDQAIASGGDPGPINEAQQALAEGDVLRSLGVFKNAVNKYKDALAKAESAISQPPAPSTGIKWPILGPILAVVIFLTIFLSIRLRRRRAFR